jgi:hypothetical protein
MLAVVVVAVTQEYQHQAEPEAQVVAVLALLVGLLLLDRQIPVVVAVVAGLQHPQLLAAQADQVS